MSNILFKSLIKRLHIVSSSSSSSSHTDSTNSLDSLIIHPYQSSFLTCLQDSIQSLYRPEECFCWLAYAGVSMCRSPLEKLAYEFVLIYPTVLTNTGIFTINNIKQQHFPLRRLSKLVYIFQYLGFLSNHFRNRSI